MRKAVRLLLLIGLLPIVIEGATSVALAEAKACNCSGKQGGDLAECMKACETPPLPIPIGGSVRQGFAGRTAITCMTDDGYGRKRPCSAGYKAANPNWRAGDSCFTDEGNGRYRPCSAGYKAKHAK
jgi:hypothetical protein